MTSRWGSGLASIGADSEGSRLALQSLRVRQDILCAGRRSIITMSLRLRVGARHDVTYAKNVLPFMARSTTNGAVSPVRRRAPTNVIVFQCPCGTLPTRRSPRGQRPRSRAILVLAAVSSMNTSLAGSSMACSRFQRRRARATSGRSCSAACRLFFEGDLVALEEAPDGGAAGPNFMPAHRRDHLIQRQIRPLGNQREQEVRMLLQRRGAAAARLGHAASRIAKTPHPFDRSAGADLEVFGRLASRSATLNAGDDTPTNIGRIGFRHCSTPEKRIKAERFTHPLASGNPPILMGRKML